jgi:hypothetical protein
MEELSQRPRNATRSPAAFGPNIPRYFKAKPRERSGTRDEASASGDRHGNRLAGTLLGSASTLWKRLPWSSVVLVGADIAMTSTQVDDGQ